MIGTGQRIKSHSEIFLLTQNAASRSRMGLINPFTGLSQPSTAGANQNIQVQNSPASAAILVLFTDWFLGLQDLVKPNHVFIFSLSTNATPNAGAINPAQVGFGTTAANFIPLELLPISQSCIFSPGMILNESGNYISVLNQTNATSLRITCQWWAIP
jgi:hypothetical protein